MELTPSPEVLEEIAERKKPKSQPELEQVQEKTAHEIKLSEQLGKLVPFVRKLKLANDATQENTLSYRRESQWVDIHEDSATYLTLQSRFSYTFIARNYTQPDNHIEQLTEYAISVRYIDRSNEEDIATDPQIIAGLRVNHVNEELIFINGGLGLEASNISLYSKEDFPDPIITQVLEIERLLLDPIMWTVINPIRH